ncbi:MAG: WYL domain-containing protein [Bacteroidetes bacterium]|nr:WYL domain-containing protein [Bacteroidota bacterium]
MSKRVSLLRFSIIINKIKQNPCSFADIHALLERESELEGSKLTVSKRTFNRDLDEIRSLYDIDIQYDSALRVYRIVSQDNIDLSNRLLEAFDLYHTIKISDNYAEVILLEKRKSQGTEHFYGLLHAIKNHFLIDLYYQKFWEEEPNMRVIAPLALKESRGRWYLLCKEGDIVKSFGLDRIKNFTINIEKFKPTAIDLPSLFKHCFGIINPLEETPENIVLSFTSDQGKYIKSYPLHESQQVISENKKELRIALKLRITHDFIMELMTFGSEMKVIEPQKLQNKLIQNFKKALELYQ